MWSSTFRTVLDKNKYNERHILLGMKIYSKIIVIDSVVAVSRIDQWNKVRSPEQTLTYACLKRICRRWHCKLVRKKKNELTNKVLDFPFGIKIKLDPSSFHKQN